MEERSFDRPYPWEHPVPSHALPLFRKGRRGQFELFGTGFFLAVEMESFLVTAGHCLVGHSSPIYVLCRGDFIEVINGTTNHYRSHEGERPDILDVAVVPVSRELSARFFGEYWFIPMECIDPNFRVDRQSTYLVFGFPVRAVEKITTTTSSLVPVGISLRLVPVHLYDRLSYDKHKNIVCRFDRRKMRDGDNQMMPPIPEPVGISGGAMWRATRRRVDEGFMDVIQLAGLITHYNPSSHTLVGVRISYALEMIRSAFPQLTDSIEATSNIKMEAQIRQADSSES